jgi:hypothetical protein
MEGWHVYLASAILGFWRCSGKLMPQPADFRLDGE